MSAGRETYPYVEGCDGTDPDCHCGEAVPPQSTPRPWSPAEIAGAKALRIWMGWEASGVAQVSDLSFVRFILDAVAAAQQAEEQVVEAALAEAIEDDCDGMDALDMAQHLMAVAAQIRGAGAGAQ